MEAVSIISNISQGIFWILQRREEIRYNKQRCEVIFAQCILASRLINQIQTTFHPTARNSLIEELQVLLDAVNEAGDRIVHFSQRSLLRHMLDAQTRELEGTLTRLTVAVNSLAAAIGVANTSKLDYIVDAAGQQSITNAEILKYLKSINTLTYELAKAMPKMNRMASESLASQVGPSISNTLVNLKGIDDQNNSQMLKQEEHRRLAMNTILEEPEEAHETTEPMAELEIYRIPPLEGLESNVVSYGAFGKVRQARWCGRPVAVKSLMRVGNIGLQSFKREFDILHKLRASPNVIRLYGFCTTGVGDKAEFHIVMEYAERGCLYSFLRNRKSFLDPGIANRIALEIGNGIAFMHNIDIVHRDLKSNNVVLDASLHAKIIDFGHSVPVSQAMAATAAPMLMAADNHNKDILFWKAPEILDGSAPASKASDTFAYTVILYEILHLRLPFSQYDARDAARKVLGCERDAIAPQWQQYAEIFRLGWAQNPEARESMGNMVKRMLHIRASSKRRNSVDDVLIRPKDLATDSLASPVVPPGPGMQGYNANILSATPYFGPVSAVYQNGPTSMSMLTRENSIPYRTPAPMYRYAESFPPMTPRMVPGTPMMAPAGSITPMMQAMGSQTPMMFPANGTVHANPTQQQPTSYLTRQVPQGYTSAIPVMISAQQPVAQNGAGTVQPQQVYFTTVANHTGPSSVAMTPSTNTFIQRHPSGQFVSYTAPNIGYQQR